MHLEYNGQDFHYQSRESRNEHKTSEKKHRRDGDLKNVEAVTDRGAVYLRLAGLCCVSRGANLFPIQQKITSPGCAFIKVTDDVNNSSGVYN